MSAHHGVYSCRLKQVADMLALWLYACLSLRCVLRFGRVCETQPANAWVLRIVARFAFLL